MEVRIAQQMIGKRQTLEVVAHIKFMRHAYAAMQLHGILAHKAATLAEDSRR